MWPLAEYRFDAKVLDTLRAEGFECAEVADGLVQASKKRVAAVFVRDPDRKLRLAEPPGFLVRGQFARLWDAGYQKFWLPAPRVDDPPAEPGQGPRVPVVASELKELHEVAEELRTVLGIPSFYNESLGTTCHVTAYDRLLGRGATAKK